MSVAYFFDYPDVDEETAERFTRAIDARRGEGPPQGGLFSASGPGDAGGRWAFNLWAADDDFNRLYQDVIVPAAEETGIDPPPHRRLEVSWGTLQGQGGAS